MNGIGPVHVHLDRAALEQVRSHLNTVIGELTALDVLGGRPSAAELGSQDVADAVTGFVNAWAHRRSGLADHLRGCVRYLEQAVHTYERSEEFLKKVDPHHAVPVDRAHA